MRLSTMDIDILAAMAEGKSPLVTSEHRLRLELMGLLRDTSAGLVLTNLGMKAAFSTPNIQHEVFEAPPRERDQAGRKRMLTRQTEFS